MHYYLPDEFTHIIATEIKKPFQDLGNADADNTPYNEWIEKMGSGKGYSWSCSWIPTTKKLELNFSDPKYTEWDELEMGKDFVLLATLTDRFLITPIVERFAMTLQEYADLEINED